MEPEEAGEEHAEGGAKGFCWLPGDLWGASLGFALILLLAGFSIAFSGSWRATSAMVVGAIIGLAVLWDKPTARFPLTLLLVGLDGGALARSGGIRVLIPPIYVAGDSLGKALAVDPAAIAVIIDAIARAISCRKATPLRDKNPPQETPSNGAAVV